MRDLLFDLKIMNSLKTMYDQFSEFSSALPTIPQILESAFLDRKTSVIAKIDLAIASNPAIKLDLEALKSGLNAGNDLTVITLPLDALLDIEGKIKLNQTTYFDLIGKREFKFKTRTVNGEVVIDVYSYSPNDIDVNGNYVESPRAVTTFSEDYRYEQTVEINHSEIGGVAYPRVQKFSSIYGEGTTSNILLINQADISFDNIPTQDNDTGTAIPIFPGIDWDVNNNVNTMPLEIKPNYTAKFSLLDGSNNVIKVYEQINVDEYFSSTTYDGIIVRKFKDDNNIPTGMIFSNLSTVSIVSPDPDAEIALYANAAYQKLEIDYDSFTYVTTLDANTPNNIFLTQGLSAFSINYLWADVESEHPIVLRSRAYEVVDSDIDYVKGSAIYLEPSKTTYKAASTDAIGSIGYIANDAPLYVDTVVGRDGYWTDEVYLTSGQYAEKRGVYNFDTSRLDTTVPSVYPVTHATHGSITSRTFVLENDGNLYAYYMDGTNINIRAGFGEYGTDRYQIKIDPTETYTIRFINNVNANSSIANHSLVIVNDLSADITGAVDVTKMTTIADGASEDVLGSDIKLILLSKQTGAIDLALPVNRSFRTPNTAFVAA